jgi:DNA-binding response OmpR family regulator
MKKLLLIDDDPIAGKFYADQFSNSDYYVEWTLDGATGLSAFARLKPQAVLLSFYLPDISGPDLIARIRAQAGQAPGIVVLLRSPNDPEAGKAARRAGAHRTGVQFSDNIVKAVRESIEEASRPAAALAAEATGQAREASSALPAEILTIETAPEPPADDLLIREEAESEAHVVKASAHADAASRLKKLSQSLSQVEDERERFRCALDLKGEIEHLASTANPLVSRMAKALVALLKDLYKPASLSPSSRRTIRQAVDVLQKLIEASFLDGDAEVPNWRVLAVDDEVVARMTVAKALTAMQLEPETAKAPSEAFELLKTRSYDLFVLDVNMPGMTGFELCQKLRASLRHAETPVIFVTALSDFETRLRFARSGADDYIAKPFVPSELGAKALQHLLARHLEAARAKANSRRPLVTGTSSARASATSPSQSGTAEAAGSRSNPGAPRELSRTITMLKVMARSLVQADREAARLSLIEDFRAKVQTLAGVEGLMVSKMSDALLAFLKDLQENPDRLGPSSLRTIQQAAEFLDKLLPIRTSELGPVQWRVLGVDDEVVARMTIIKALAVVQIKAETANSPAEALELLKSRSYDLFIFDVNMPGMTGFELCEKLRTSRVRAKVPVIFATARSDFESRLRFANSGADDFIAKPFLASELATKSLQQLLSSKLGLS